MTETHSFAQRRPGWQLPSLNLVELQLESFEPLERAAKRQPCPNCGKSRSLFCYDCQVPFTSIPSLQLPFQLHIITHSAERFTKATGVHAAVLCKGQVHLQSLEQLPQLDPARSVVMFPSYDALLPDQLPLEQLEHVIIIDSKWRKARELNGHPALEGMKRVKLPGNPRSSFWRFHTEETTDEGVCTIEALHLLMKALAERLPPPASHWDNLLWYYAYQHKIIERAAADRAGKRQLQEKQGGYVQQKKKKGHQQPPQQQPGENRQPQPRQQQAGESQQQQLQPQQDREAPQHANGKMQQVQQGQHQQQQHEQCTNCSAAPPCMQQQEETAVAEQQRSTEQQQQQQSPQGVRPPPGAEGAGVTAAP